MFLAGNHSHYGFLMLIILERKIIMASSGRVVLMKFMKLKTKYILSYALTILCPILLFLGIILNVVSNVIVKQSIENEVQINKQFKNNVGYIFKDYASIVNRLCYSGELQNLVGLDAETLQKNLSSFLNQKEIIRSSILFYNYQGHSLCTCGRIPR